MENTGDEYFEAFNAKIKTKTFEQFTLLLCDLSKATPEQKRLLGTILFENHQSPENWVHYLEYITSWFGDRKLQIQRLYCKAIELIPENEITRNNPKYLQLHLQVASMKSTIEDKCKYYEQTLQRKCIGIKLSSLYLTWAAALVSKDSFSEAVTVIEKGLQNRAEPRLLLSNQLKELYHVIKERTAKKRSITCFDNGEVQFKRRIRRASDSSDEKTDSHYENDMMEDEATEKIEPLLPLDTFFSSSTKKAAASKLTPRGLSGKCQRVVHATTTAAAQAEAGTLEEPPPVVITTRISMKKSGGAVSMSSSDNASSFAIFEDHPLPSPPAVTSVQEVMKEKPASSLKAKYIDDALRNFNPSTATTKKITTVTTAVTSSKEEASVKIPSFLDNMGITPALILPTTSNTRHTTDSSSLSSSSKVTMQEQDEETEKMPTHDLQQLLAQAPIIAHKLAATTASSTSTTATAGSAAEGSQSAPLVAPMLSVERSPMMTGTTNGGKRKRVSFSADPISMLPGGTEVKRTASAQQVSTLAVTTAASQGSAAQTMFNDPNKQIIINNHHYIQLSHLGKGGSSTVHRVISTHDGAIYALKTVNVKDQEDSDTVLDSYCNEIRLLQSLKGTSPYIIDLIDYEIKKEDNTVLMVLEAGDIDLAKLLNQRMKSARSASSSAVSSSTAAAAASQTGALDPIFTRLVWKEMLLAVNHIHTHRIVHGDLKPANFVFVKGHLKLIDFGIAKSFSTDTTNIYRESQIGTVNYMAPEAICPDSITRSDAAAEDSEGNEQGKNKAQEREKAHYTMKLGRASDIWSLGCILYQMLYGRPPFAHLNTIQKLSAIPNPNYMIVYPEHEEKDGVISVQACLVRQPKERMPITELLEMSYLMIGNCNTSPIKTSNKFNNNSFDTVNVKNVLSVLRKEAVRMLGGNTASNTQSKKVQAWFDSLNPEDILHQSLNPNKNDEDLNEDDEATEEEVNDDDTTIKLPSSDDEKEQSQHSQPSNASKQGRKALSTLTSSIINARNNAASVPSSASKKLTLPLLKKSTFVKSPVKVLPMSLKVQIATQAHNLRSTKGQDGISNAEKWMKKKDEDPENLPMHVMLANRIGAMRKFMDLDQDNVTATESMDISGIHDFF